MSLSASSNKAQRFSLCLMKDASRKIGMATKMTMTRFHVLAIAAGLLLAVSGPSFAAKRMSDTKSAATAQARATKPSGSAIRPYSRDPYPYSRAPDPYAPGVNWPKSD